MAEPELPGFFFFCLSVCHSTCARRRLSNVCFPTHLRSNPVKVCWWGLLYFAKYDGICGCDATLVSLFLQTESAIVVFRQMVGCWREAGVPPRDTPV